MKPMSQEFLFWILVAMTAVVGIASLWLISRSGKVQGMRLPGMSKRFVGLLHKGPFARLLESVQYLLTSREARYATPWVLLVGEKGAGKSSLARSCSAQLKDPCPPGKEAIDIHGAKWHAFGSGELIDPDGGMGTHGERAWKDALDAIDMLRPERPIDKLVVVLNARTLMSDDSDALAYRAKETLIQLESIQERFEFAFPIYLVITHCDAITGFTAFWNAQKASLREQIFGWSAPLAMQSQSTDKWVPTAFATLQDRLRQLLYASAASNDDIEEVDQVFMFPVSFNRLSDPLSRWFEMVFQPTRLSQAFFCRGIYFTGSPVASGEVEDGHRPDVAFVHDLFRDRVFAEQHLAQPIRQSIWSRNRMIRRIQYAALVCGVTLLFGLAFSTKQASRQVDSLDSILDSMSPAQIQPVAGGCQDADSILALLRRIALLDSRSFYPAIPASWFDDRERGHIAQQISESGFRDVVMPAIACRIRKKAEALVAIDVPPVPGIDPLTPLRRRFLDYLGKVNDLELNVKRFATISRSVGQEEKSNQLEEFGKMFAYAFDRPMPKEVSREKGMFSMALANFSYDKHLILPLYWRMSYAKQIREMSDSLRSALDNELVSGPKLLESMDRSNAPGYSVQDDSPRLLWWLNWVRQSWLGASASRNPCEDIRSAEAPIMEGLLSHKKNIKYLEPVADSFGEKLCFQPSLRTLTGLSMAPFGNMFFSDGQTLKLNPELGKEFSGLGEVMEMPYMHLETKKRFFCSNDLSGWNGALLHEANSYARQYLGFASSHKITSNDENNRLYLRLARRQLDAVMSGRVDAAQLSSLPDLSLSGASAISSGERELMDESGKFHDAVPVLLETLDLFGQIGFTARARQVAQCAREYSADSLSRIYSLADGSRLYDPGSVDSSFPLPGDIAVTRDWLARQVSRIRVLAGYAAQYVAFLKNSQGLDDHLWSEDQDAAFWDNTIAELDRYLQFKETNGQVAHLNDLFVNVLTGMNADNCRVRLSAYQAPDYGNDLFSRLRRLRLSQATAQCEERRDEPATEAYRMLSDRFNRELAGRYPFASPDERDASPVEMKAFLADYAANRKKVDALAEGGGQPKVRRFLQQMDAVAAFFAGNLSQAPASVPLRLGIHFDTLPGKSPGANQVISWAAASGDAVASDNGGSASLEWSWRPMEFRFTWAKNSLWRPLAGDGETVVFPSGGPWSLLRLIQMHGMRPQPSPDPVSPDRIQLEFEVPVGQIGKGKGMMSRLHVALELFDSKSATALAPPPQFPYAAPALAKE